MWVVACWYFITKNRSQVIFETSKFTIPVILYGLVFTVYTVSNILTVPVSGIQYPLSVIRYPLSVIRYPVLCFFPTD